MIPLRRTTRAGVAHHEAGHAIVGLQLGFKIVEASIVEREADGYTRLGFVEFEPEPTLDIPARIIRIAAGPIAQRYYSETLNQAFNASGDEEQIEALKEALPGSFLERAATVERLRRTAHEMVIANWRAIEALAETLQCRGAVTGAELFAAIEQGHRDLADVLVAA